MTSVTIRRKTGEKAALLRPGPSMQKGQSLMEFALIMPVLMVLVFGIIDFGMGLRSYISLVNGAREGARYAASGNPAGTYPDDCASTASTAVGQICGAMGDLDLSQLESISVTYPSGQTPGSSVIVEATYQYDFVTPVGQIFNFFTKGSFEDHLHLEISSDMRME